MRRDRLSILVVLTALLAIGLVGAALVAPSGADAGQSADRTITVDATGSADAEPDRSAALLAALGAVPPALAGRRRPP